MTRKRDRRRLDEVAGRRVETTEWGLRRTRDSVFGKQGTVEPVTGERHARELEDRQYSGYAGTEVVKRTVVTYTTGWEPAPVSTVPELVDMTAVLEGRAELPWKVPPATPAAVEEALF